MKMGYSSDLYCMEAQVVTFEQIVERGCGMDVHKDTVVATVSGTGIKTETRTCTTFTNDLNELRDWLKSLQVTHVAMESTGIYWKPVFNILEEDFEILLVNARHVKNVPGHKTDKKDSKWLSKLLLSGLLKASFIPPRDIRELRDLFRYRRKLTSHIIADRNRFEKILQDANFKLSSVISDIFGVTGTKLINALIAGQNDFEELLKLCDKRIQAKRETLQQALVGKLTSHHKFMLLTLKKSLASTQQLIDEVDHQIDEQTKQYRVEIQLLQTIPGISKISSVALLSEIGADMSKFPNEHHLASWAGMSPGNNESAGKKKVEEPLMEINI
jgi:transposase